MRRPRGGGKTCATLDVSWIPVTEPIAPATTSASVSPRVREIVQTLFELGREVTSVLDLDELLQKIPQLIARLTKFQAFAVYLLDPKREELSIAYSVGYPEEVAAPLRLKVGQGLVGAAVAEGQAPARERRARRSALRRGGAGVERRARRAAAPQGPRHRRAQPPERHASASSPRPTRRCCGSSPRTSPSRSRTRGCSSTSASTPARSKRSPKSPASSAPFSISTSC